MTLRLGVLASGSGTNFQAILDSITRQALDAELRLIVCNRPGAGVIEKARLAGIPCRVMDHTLWSSREQFDRDVAACLQAADVDTVALAGYMRILSPVFLKAFPERVLNIHPALLPAFPGLHGIKDALNEGVKISGCTVHLVDEIMDHGAIIIQAAIPCIAGESPEAFALRMHAQEHRIYPQALQWLAEGRLHIEREKRQIRLLPGKHIRCNCGPDALFSPPLEEGF